MPLRTLFGSVWLLVIVSFAISFAGDHFQDAYAGKKGPKRPHSAPGRLECSDNSQIDPAIQALDPYFISDLSNMVLGYMFPAGPHSHFFVTCKEEEQGAFSEILFQGSVPPGTLHFTSGTVKNLSYQLQISVPGSLETEMVGRKTYEVVEKEVPIRTPSVLPNPALFHLVPIAEPKYELTILKATPPAHFSKPVKWFVARARLTSSNTHVEENITRSDPTSLKIQFKPHQRHSHKFPSSISCEVKFDTEFEAEHTNSELDTNLQTHESGTETDLQDPEQTQA